MDRIQSDREIEGTSDAWGDGTGNVWNDEDPWRHNTNEWNDEVDDDNAWTVGDIETTGSVEADTDKNDSELMNIPKIPEGVPEEIEGKQESEADEATDHPNTQPEEVEPVQDHDKSTDSDEATKNDVLDANDDDDEFNEFDDFEEFSEGPPPNASPPLSIDHIAPHHLDPTKLNIYDIETHLASIFASVTSPPRTDYPEDTILDVHSKDSPTNPRKLINQFRRPTRQFVCLDSKPDPIVRWRASAVEGEVLKVLQHWKEREYSKSRNALFGWANKRSASVKAPAVPQAKETSSMRVVSDNPQTRLSHSQVQPQVQQRFNSSAHPADDISIKRPAPLRMDKIKGHAKTASVSMVPVSTGNMGDWPMAMPQTPSITSRPPPFPSPRGHSHSRQASVNIAASERSSPMNATFASSNVILPASFASQLASPTEMRPAPPYEHLSSTKSRSTSNTPPLIADSMSVFSKPSPPPRPSSALAPAANNPPPAAIDQFAIFDSKPLPNPVPQKELDDPFSIFESKPPPSKRSSVVLPSSFASALASPTEMKPAKPAKPTPTLHSTPPPPPPPPKTSKQDDDDWGDFQTDSPSPPLLAPSTRTPPAAAAPHAGTTHTMIPAEVDSRKHTTIKLGPVSKTKQQSKSSDDEVVHRIVDTLPDLSYLL